MQGNISFSMEDLQSRIVPGKPSNGQLPSIRNSNFTVSEILDLVIEGMSIDEIIVEHPTLEREDIMAAIFFASEAAKQRVPEVVGA